MNNENLTSTCDNTNSSLVMLSWVLMSKYHTVDKHPHCLQVKHHSNNKLVHNRMNNKVFPSDHCKYEL